MTVVLQHTSITGTTDWRGGGAGHDLARVAGPGMLLPTGELQGVLKQAMPSLGEIRCTVTS